MGDSPRCVVIIPARGGSKGVPRKNVRDLAGRPLIAHAIECASAAKRVHRVVVSTDDSEIAAVAERFGADVVERPDDLSGDTATSESAVLHALSVLSLGQEAPDLVGLMQCTSPLTAPEDLDGAIEKLIDEKAASCFTAAPFHHFLWSEGEDGAAEPVGHDGGPRKRRQDLAPRLLENGAFYVMQRKAFLEAETRFCGRTVVHETPASRTLEIDDEEDFVVAEARVRLREKHRRASVLPAPPSALIFDFDGVFTDNAVIVREDAIESVRCSRGDGMGLGLVRKAGFPVLVMSKERNPVVGARMKKLSLEYMQAVDDKLPLLEEWLAERGLDLSETIYVGNDVNDLPCLRAVGCGVCPSDAHPEAMAASRLVLENKGGYGAVRELCDLVLAGPPPASASS